MPPTGIPAATLSRMRACSLKLMPDTLNIQKETLVSDGSGGKKRGISVVATGVQCYVGAPHLAGNDSDLGMDVRVSVRDVDLPYNAPIDRDCEVDYVSRDGRTEGVDPRSVGNIGKGRKSNPANDRLDGESGVPEIPGEPS